MPHGTLTPRLAPADDGAERGITRGCRLVRAGRAAAVAVVALTMVTGCARPASPPAGSGRYRDEVSRNVTATRTLTYGQAPGRSGARETLTLDLYQPAGDDLAACAPNTVSGSNTVSGCGNVVSGVSNVVQGNYNVVSGVSNTVYGSCLVVSGVGGSYTGNDC
jgi:hypothetical protein